MSLLCVALYARCPYYLGATYKVSLLLSALYAESPYYLVHYTQSVLLNAPSLCRSGPSRSDGRSIARPRALGLRDTQHKPVHMIVRFTFKVSLLFSTLSAKCPYYVVLDTCMQSVLVM